MKDMTVNEDINIRNFTEKATSGILNLYEADYKKQQVRLGEFLMKQSQLLSTLDQELAKLIIMESLQLEDMMSILKSCQSRLNAIKDRMRKASLKAKKLKERSLKIQQIKQKESLERELRREAQLTREQEMVAKSSSIHKLQNFDIITKSNPSKESAVNLTS